MSYYVIQKPQLLSDAPTLANQIKCAADKLYDMYRDDWKGKNSPNYHSIIATYNSLPYVRSNGIAKDKIGRAHV